MTAGGWFKCDRVTWEMVAAALPKPWPFAMVVADLERWDAGSSVGEKRPSQAGLCQRWGWSRSKVRTAIERRQAIAKQSPSVSQPVANQSPSEVDESAIVEAEIAKQSPSNRQAIAKQSPSNRQPPLGDAPAARIVDVPERESRDLELELENPPKPPTGGAITDPLLDRLHRQSARLAQPTPVAKSKPPKRRKRGDIAPTPAHQRLWDCWRSQTLSMDLGRRRKGAAAHPGAGEAPPSDAVRVMRNILEVYDEAACLLVLEWGHQAESASWWQKNGRTGVATLLKMEKMGDRLDQARAWEADGKGVPMARGEYRGESNGPPSVYGSQKKVTSEEYAEMFNELGGSDAE